MAVKLRLSMPALPRVEATFFAFSTLTIIFIRTRLPGSRKCTGTWTLQSPSWCTICYGFAGQACNQTHKNFWGTIHDNPLNLAEYARKYKFLQYAASPTTGISINRRMANLLFPIPENIRIAADGFIVYGASLVGELQHIGDVLGGYRIHGNNNWHIGWSVRQKAGGTGFSVEFVETLDHYLTQKLKENQLPGRISYSDSMLCWADMALDGRWTELAWKVAKENAAQHDRHTWDYTKTICNLILFQLTKSALSPTLYDFMKKHYRRIRGIPFDAVKARNGMPFYYRKPRL